MLATPGFGWVRGDMIPNDIVPDGYPCIGIKDRKPYPVQIRRLNFKIAFEFKRFFTVFCDKNLHPVPDGFKRVTGAG